MEIFEKLQFGIYFWTFLLLNLEQGNPSEFLRETKFTKFSKNCYIYIPVIVIHHGQEYGHKDVNADDDKDNKEQG